VSKVKSEADKTKEAAETIDVRVLKALGHPLRQRVLQALNEDVASPNQVANKLGEPLSNVSYHVKILESCDAIELVRTEPVRGALEHFYRATMRPRLEEEHWALLPDSAKNDLTAQTLAQIGRHAGDAAAVGGFNDPKSAVAWVDLELDDEAYAKIGEEVVKLLNLATDLHAESAVRLAELDDEERKSATHRAELALLLFHRA